MTAECGRGMGLEQTVNCRIHKHKINKPPSPAGSVVLRRSNADLLQQLILMNKSYFSKISLSKRLILNTEL